MVNYSWVIDQRKCIGCHACTTACKSENEVPLSVDRTWVKYVEKGTFPNSQRHFGVLRCNHCAKPPCVYICPVTAMFQRPDGVVEFDKDACIGCKACIAACPYDAIYIDPSNGTAAKCNFCAHRLDVGLEPACVVVCPEEALVFGDLEDPLSKVSQLIGREKTQVRKPEKNTDPKCFYIG
ncbi:MAG: 4Fe-4S dicluster domain-containing protein, partial [Cyanobacteria bacterium]|nr:4Fe-4S dicluster domain-containing protein [Cyanobacteriota bacterium]